MANFFQKKLYSLRHIGNSNTLLQPGTVLLPLLYWVTQCNQKSHKKLHMMKSWVENLFLVKMHHIWL